MARPRKIIPAVTTPAAAGQRTGEIVTITNRVDDRMFLDPAAAIPVSIDMRVTPDALVNIAIVDAQDRLNTARKSLESTVSTLQDDHIAATARLLAAAKEVVTHWTPGPDAKAVVDALTRFEGKQHAAVLDIYTPYGTYSRTHSSQLSDDLEINIERHQITTKLVIGAYKTAPYEAADQPVVSREVTLPFSAAMNEEVQQLARIKTAHDKAVAQLVTIRQQLCNMPKLRERVQAALTRASLKGELVNGQQLLTTVMAGTEQFLLPEHV